MSKLVLFTSTRLRSATLANQPIVWIGTDDVALAREVADFLELVHQTQIELCKTDDVGFWVRFRRRISLNISSLHVAVWLYQVELGRAQL